MSEEQKLDLERMNERIGAMSALISYCIAPRIAGETLAGAIRWHQMGQRATAMWSPDGVRDWELSVTPDSGSATMKVETGYVPISLGANGAVIWNAIQYARAPRG
jgi:hypothetical protein